MYMCIATSRHRDIDVYIYVDDLCGSLMEITCKSESDDTVGLIIVEMEERKEDLLLDGYMEETIHQEC